MIIACNKLCCRGEYEANSDHENDAHDCDQEEFIIVIIVLSPLCLTLPALIIMMISMRAIILI